jgi:2'-5' RNA ligase
MLEVKMARLFVAIRIPEKIKQELALIKGGLHGARWTPIENHHISLRFIGDVDSITAEEIHYNLSKVKADAFDMHLRTIGFFGKVKKEPRVLWTGVSDYKLLDNLNEKVERVVSRSQIEPMKQKFHAHCTIGKLKNCTIDDVQQYIIRNNLFKSSEFKVKSFHLLSSTLSRDGAKYTEIEEYPLNEIEYLHKS